jgi:phosphoribosylformimino-5-aminoimidazole carboxamide ribotide isomerase
MQVIPAIDLQAGRCVRLLRGEFDRETVYGDDPAEIAREWRETGAQLAHVVDLDGARLGRPAQLELVKRMAAEIPVQLGGGLRDEAAVQHALSAGVQRVVIGTAAVDPDKVRGLTESFGDRLVVALDTRNGVVATEGWVESSGQTMIELARALTDVGVCRFLHTDVDRDGALTSPNFESLSDLVSLGVPVIASGGVASLDHIRRLQEEGAEAVIVGRALYERVFTLQEAAAVAG